MTKKLRIFLLSTAAAGVLAFPAAAQDSGASDINSRIEALQAELEALKAKQVEMEKQQAENGFDVKWEPAPAIRSRDGRFEFNIRGRIFADAGWANDDKDTMDINATEFRAARLGIEGLAWQDIKYKFEVDFAGEEVTTKDAYLQWKGPADITLGLEEQTSSRYITFLERASITDAFGLARQMGAGLAWNNENVTASFGAFRGGSGTGDDDEGTTLAARLTYGHTVEGFTYHIGGSVRYRERGDDQGDFRYRQRPHHHLSDRFVNTERLADSDTFYGVELAGLWGALAVQGEYAWLNADLSDTFRASNPALTMDPTFSGGYVDVSWFLTGENRAYDPADGGFGRIRVNDPVFQGGTGAWQIAARFDTIDLADEGIFGGEQDTYIIGLNWYLNRHTRLMFNYSHSDVSQSQIVNANGPDGKNDIDTFGIRAQVDW